VKQPILLSILHIGEQGFKDVLEASDTNSIASLGLYTNTAKRKFSQTVGSKDAVTLTFSADLTYSLTKKIEVVEKIH
jgi:hypothetical protein